MVRPGSLVTSIGASVRELAAAMAQLGPYRDRLTCLWPTPRSAATR